MRAAQPFRHLALALCAAACATAKPATTPSPSQQGRTGTPATTSKPAAGRPAGRDTTVVSDPEMERRVARLELRIIEKDAQIEDLQSRLDDSRAEVVRTLAKIQSSTSRAEAASGVAEAELALRSLQSGEDTQSPGTQQVSKIVQQSSAEFDKRNYGGALYLANQAKALAASYTAARGSSNGVKLRSGETAFAIPLHFKVSSRANVREGPGTTFGIAFSVEAGTILSGVSYLDEWIHVTADDGRTGWIFRTLVVKP